jgi:hypothetical protein
MGLRKNIRRPTSVIIDIDVDSRVGIPFFVAGVVIAFFWGGAGFLIPIGIGIFLLGKDDKVICRVGLGFLQLL